MPWDGITVGNRRLGSPWEGTAYILSTTARQPMSLSGGATGLHVWERQPHYVRRQDAKLLFHQKAAQPGVVPKESWEVGMTPPGRGCRDDQAKHFNSGLS